MLGTLYSRFIRWWGSHNPPEIDRREVDSLAVSEVVESYYQKHTHSRTRVNRFDSRYYVCSRSDMKRILDSDKTDWRLYASETYDCENFAFTFMVNMQTTFGLNSVGVVSDGLGDHAYNCWVLEGESGLEIQLIEPQSGELVEPGQDEQYAFDRVTILV